MSSRLALWAWATTRMTHLQGWPLQGLQDPAQPLQQQQQQRVPQGLQAMVLTMTMLAGPTRAPRRRGRS